MGLLLLHVRKLVLCCYDLSFILDYLSFEHLSLLFLVRFYLVMSAIDEQTGFYSVILLLYHTCYCRGFIFQLLILLLLFVITSSKIVLPYS